jgi:hypothetical protein
VVAAVVALVSGCDVVSFVMNDGVSQLITPQQSKDQVVAAATGIVGLPAAFDFRIGGRSGCVDGQRLESRGRSSDSEFRSHGATLKENGVVAVLGPRAAQGWWTRIPSVVAMTGPQGQGCRAAVSKVIGTPRCQSNKRTSATLNADGHPRRG